MGKYAAGGPQTAEEMDGRPWVCRRENKTERRMEMLDMIQCTSGGAYYARGEWVPADGSAAQALAAKGFDAAAMAQAPKGTMRSEEHTSELQSPR